MKKIYRVTEPFSKDYYTEDYPKRFIFYSTKKEAMKHGNTLLKKLKTGEWEIDVEYHLFPELQVDIIHFKEVPMKQKLLLIANGYLSCPTYLFAELGWKENLLSVDVMKEFFENYKGGEK